MEHDDEPTGGDPPCWAHLFEDAPANDRPPAPGPTPAFPPSQRGAPQDGVQDAVHDPGGADLPRPPASGR